MSLSCLILWVLKHKNKMVNGRERKIQMINSEKIVMKEFDSVQEAATFVKRVPKGIRRAINCNSKCADHFFQYAPQQVYDNEIWKKHPSLPIRVSSIGRIERENGMQTFGTKMNKTQDYKRVHLKTSRKSSRLVHRLVAETFLPNH